MEHAGTGMSRRRFGTAAAGLVVGGLVGAWDRAGSPEAASGGFSRDWLLAQARALAQTPFDADRYAGDGPDDPALRRLTYDEVRTIRHRPEASLWFDEGRDFLVDFFHLGGLFTTPVRIFEIAEDGSTRPLAFRRSAFGAPPDVAAVLEGAAGGFAGLRLHYPIETPPSFSEFAVFLGASYFRAISAGTRYGTSARGIAIDTGLEGEEEFPAFRSFWIERPRRGSRQIVLHALLDGPSVTGAYRFALAPGRSTTVDVSASLFARRAIRQLGIAPLTSMFFFGSTGQRGADDFRGQIHDAEGLAMWTGRGEWIWRPLSNPRQVLRSHFGDRGPRGFGLLQRERSFGAYADLEARYELRPSVWIEPMGDWGEGSVRLVEIPTGFETEDNIAAFWTPAGPTAAGEALQFDYRMHWGMAPPWSPRLGQVTAMRMGAAGVSSNPDPDWRRIVLDFGGGPLDAVARDAPVVFAVTVSGGELGHVAAEPNDAIGGWRAMCDVRAAGEGPVELRGVLRLGTQTLTESWAYQLSPPGPPV